MRFSGVQSEKFLKRKRKQLYTRLTLGVLLAISAVLGLGKLSSWSKVSVPEVVVVGNDVVRSEDIVALANEHMAGNYLFLFSKRNMMLYPKNAIGESISEQFKRIKDISLNLKEENKLEVSITERGPVGLWCADTCFYLDETGYVFEDAPQFSEEVYLTYKGDIKESPIGKTYLTPVEFTAVRNLVFNIEKLGLTPTTIIKKDHDEYEVKIKNGQVQGVEQPDGTIYLNKKQSFESSFENLSAFVAQYQTKNPAGLKSIDYIDLRFGKNIVYKFN